MEIEKLRQEINDLLENVNEHSERFSGRRNLPSLEVSFVMNKISKMQEKLAVLKYQLEKREAQEKARRKESMMAHQENQVQSTSINEENEQIPEEQELVQEVVSEVSVEPIALNEEPASEVEENVGNNDTNTPPHQTLQNFKDAFTLNDRYLYANELFDKDMAKFNDFVTKIDGSVNSEDAHSVINSLGFEEDNEHIENLRTLIERRFS